MVMLLSVGNVWAAEVTYSLTPDATSTGSSATSYQASLSFTYEGVSWTMAQFNPSTRQTKTNQSSATAEFNFHNTSAFPGRITQVVVKYKALTIATGKQSGFMFLGGTSEVIATTEGTSGTWNSTDKTFTWTPAANTNYTYFAYYMNGKTATGSNYLAEANAIVVTYDDGQGGGSDPVAVTGVTLNKSELSLEVDESETLTATIAPNNATNKNISWESSNTAVATVTNGEVTAVAEGSATITVTTEDGSFTDECAVTITAAAPAVEFVKFSGDIEEGDYVIYYGGKVVKNIVASNRLSYDEVTPVNNKIKNPSDAIIWHIAPAETEGYWTLYNENVSKYAVCTNSNNQANLNATATANALVTVSEVSEGSYEILSKARQDASSNNYYFRNNGTYGFAFYASGTGGALTLYKNASATPAVAKPTISGEENFVGSTSVSISHADADHIYYTTNGDAPTTSSAVYSAPFSLTNNATVKAIAVKGGVSSAVAEKTFTKVEALTTMQAIFDAATSTATPTYITFSNAWVVTGVSTNGKNVYITDGTKGMILYNGAGNMGLVVGNTLSGTVQRSLKLYNGAAELDGFTTDGLTKGTASVPAVQELDADGIGALSGVNTGALIKISGACTEESSKLYVAGVQLYNSLFAYTAPTAGNNYNITGVYVQYNSTKEILPRSAADIDEIVDPDKVATPTFSPAGGEYDEAQSVTIACATEDATIYYTIDGTNPSTSSSVYSSAIAVSETTTIKAFAVKDGMTDSDIASATYTISAGGDPTPTVTFNYEDYKGEGTSSSGSEYTMVKTDIVSIGSTTFFGNNSYAHFYANGVITVTPSTGVTIKEIVIGTTSTSYNGYQSSGTITASAGSVTKDSEDEKIVRWTGSADAAFTISHNKQIRWTTIVVTYETADPSAPALAVSPTAIDFGDIEQGESVSAQTVVVNFANLTGAVTYSGLSSPFTATGSISASGDEITISADASTIGEYEQTLTVTSVADGKSATVTVTMNVIPVVSGDVYTKLTGSIEEGDYVIYFEGKALKNTIASSRFEYEEVTPVNNKISDPDPSIVWSISQSGEYWTIYNDAVSKYAGATGSNNQGALLDAAGDKALWSISGTGAFDITNKYQSDNSKNAYLRNNGTYGFACYAVGTGGSLVLYKAANSKAPAGLAWSTDAVVIAVGDDFTAPTLSNPNNIAANEIDITSSNTSLATVTAGVVSLVENATGEATITATFAGNDNYKAATVSYTIIVSEAGDDLSGTWALVTDAAQLAAGKKVVIAYCGLDGNYIVAKTMGAQNTNNRAAVESSTKTATDYTSLTLGPGTKVFTLVDAGDGKFAIKASNGKYLTSATSGTSNNLLEAADYSLDNAKWTISISNEVASIVAAAGSKTVMQYNSGSTIFSCYGTASQKPVRIYMLQEDTPEPPTPDWTEVRSELTIGKHYTICLKKQVTAAKGGTFWTIGKHTAHKVAYLEEAQLPLTAGEPFIFQATADKLEVVYEGEDASEPAIVAGNALRGTFEYMNAAALEAACTNMYMLSNNQICSVTHNNGNFLSAFRAYIDDDAMIDVSSAPQPVPGRKVKSVPMQGNVATGIDDARTSMQATKMLIDGQLFIIYGEKMYDATGSLVK